MIIAVLKFVLQFKNLDAQLNKIRLPKFCELQIREYPQQVKGDKLQGGVKNTRAIREYLATIHGKFKFYTSFFWVCIEKKKSYKQINGEKLTLDFLQFAVSQYYGRYFKFKMSGENQYLIFLKKRPYKK